MAKEPKSLPPVPTWEELKADKAFKEWHSSPFLRMLTAALRENHPVSGAADTTLIVHNSGAMLGWLNALAAIDSFCKLDVNDDTRESKSIPYQIKNHEQED